VGFTPRVGSIPTSGTILPDKLAALRVGHAGGVSGCLGKLFGSPFKIGSTRLPSIISTGPELRLCPAIEIGSIRGLEVSGHSMSTAINAVRFAPISSPRTVRTIRLSRVPTVGNALDIGLSTSRHMWLVALALAGHTLVHQLPQTRIHRQIAISIAMHVPTSSPVAYLAVAHGIPHRVLTSPLCACKCRTGRRYLWLYNVGKI
jgi:hypothetical protein